MIIPIHIAASSPSSSNKSLLPQLAQYGADELVLIELQGELEVEGDNAGQVVGKLTVDENSKKPTLLIAHHLLEGKLVNLPKPLAVLHRPSSEVGVEESEDVEMDGTGRDESKQQRGWDVVAVVKRKMVFSKRPMPMVGKVAAIGGKKGG